MNSSTLLDPCLLHREILAWTFCETQRQMENLILESKRDPNPTHLQNNGRLGPYGPVSWLAVWEEQNKSFIETMTEVELGEAMLFFAEEFYPKVDYWRARVGFERVPDIWAGLHVQWPSAQHRPIIVSIQHGPERFEVETGWQIGSRIDGILRLQWLRQFWAWEKGVQPSAYEWKNFESTSVTETD